MKNVVFIRFSMYIYLQPLRKTPLLRRNAEKELSRSPKKFQVGIGYSKGVSKCDLQPIFGDCRYKICTIGSQPRSLARGFDMGPLSLKFVRQAGSLESQAGVAVAV